MKIKYNFLVFLLVWLAATAQANAMPAIDWVQ
ncbi:MAG: hypothetical protein ACI9KM_000356, partial [Rubritalea sp.]